MRQRHRANLLTAALITMAVFIATAAKAPECPVRVLVTPRLGISPLAVTVRVSIPAPTADWSCPEIRLSWPDGTESKSQSDCDPDDPSFDPFVRTRLFGPGNWEVVVHVKQGINERVFRQMVEVIG